jgi:hypothetical protein
LDKIINPDGYTQPPFNVDATTYQIYISELGSGLYGMTVPDPDPINLTENPPRYRTYIEIDNDFRAVYKTSRGMPGLKVTLAHEFHHAIQLGAYGFREKDRYFYEITSTWMEDYIYNDVNDYYQYIKYSNNQPRGHFANPDLSFIYTDGLIEYSRAIWGKFIQENYSPRIMRIAWENVSHEPCLKAMDDALVSNSSSFRIAFNDFSQWNYFTGAKAIPGKYYSEAQDYPAIKQKSPIELLGGYRTYQDSINTLSSAYLPVIYNGQEVVDNISNVNMVSAYNYIIKNYSFTYVLSETDDGSIERLQNGAYAKLDVLDPLNWIIGGILTFNRQTVSVYPNPCIDNGNMNLYFMLPATNEFTAKLYVYNSAMELEGSYEKNINPIDPRIMWDLTGNKGVKVSSGIYYFVISLNNQEYIGKFAVIRK